MFVEAHEQSGSTNLVERGMLHHLCNKHGIITIAKFMTPLADEKAGTQHEIANMVVGVLNILRLDHGRTGGVASRLDYTQVHWISLGLDAHRSKALSLCSPHITMSIPLMVAWTVAWTGQKALSCSSNLERARSSSPH